MSGQGTSALGKAGRGSSVDNDPPSAIDDEIDEAARRVAEALDGLMYKVDAPYLSKLGRKWRQQRHKRLYEKEIR